MIVSMQRVFVVIGLVALLFLGGFIGSWIQRQFPNENTVVIGRHELRVVHDVQIKEVTKWRERVMSCVDLVELVPRGMETDPSPSFVPDTKKEERSVARLEERFFGQLDLSEQALLSTLDIPAGGRYGWRVAATTSRKAPSDGSPRKVTQTAVENDAPKFAFGHRTAWYLGGGPGYLGHGFEPVVGAGLSRDSFSTKRIDWTARLLADYGLESKEPVFRLLFTAGGEKWDGH